MVAQAYNPSPWKVETRVSELWSWGLCDPDLREKGGGVEIVTTVKEGRQIGLSKRVIAFNRNQEVESKIRMGKGPGGESVLWLELVDLTDSMHLSECMELYTLFGVTRMNFLRQSLTMKSEFWDPPSCLLMWWLKASTPCWSELYILKGVGFTLKPRQINCSARAVFLR